MVRRRRVEGALRVAKEQADKASRTKSAFLASMSHALRTPLNAVMGFAQLLEVDEQLNREQRDYVRENLGGGHRLLGLINEVLDLEKIESGHFELAPVEWESGDMLRELEGVFRPRAARKGIDLRIECASEVPNTLRSDAKRVHQVLANLLDNAIKYTEQGMVWLHVAFAKGDLILEVSDTGIGIPAEELERIFEPFHQLREGPRGAPGTGLGVTITRQLVQRMGARSSWTAPRVRAVSFEFTFRRSRSSGHLRKDQRPYRPPRSRATGPSPARGSCACSWWMTSCRTGCSCVGFWRPSASRSRRPRAG